MPILQQFIVDRFSKEKTTYVLLKELESGDLSIKYNRLGLEPDNFWEEGDVEFKISKEKEWKRLKKDILKKNKTKRLKR